MKIQWNYITPFAKRMLRKLGACPTSELLAAEIYAQKTAEQLRKVMREYSRVFPLHDGMVDCSIMQDLQRDQIVIRTDSRSYQYCIRKADLIKMRFNNPIDLANIVASETSRAWGQAIFEMVRKMIVEADISNE